MITRKALESWCIVPRHRLLMDQLQGYAPITYSLGMYEYAQALNHAMNI